MEILYYLLPLLVVALAIHLLSLRRAALYDEEIYSRIVPSPKSRDRIKCILKCRDSVECIDRCQ
jgi:hypothetical protein